MLKAIKKYLNLKTLSVVLILFGLTNLIIIGSTSPDVGFFANFISIFFSAFAILITLQALFTIYWMLYGWNFDQTDDVEGYTSVKPKYSFSMILPARHEAVVIPHTIESIAKIDYPYELKEIVLVFSDDDEETIKAAEKMMYSIDYCKIKMVLYKGPPFSKPIGLNHAVTHCEGDIVTIFDAEDDVSPDILKIVNGKMVKENLDIVQCGVQLMNIYTNWFSTLNCMEYFFWFKSALKFFANQGVIPLGGNTVFFKRKYLYKVGGWDIENLTEDCDIGLRLSSEGLKFGVFYHHDHSTREETPDTVQSFVKQRTRWIQGFMQILRKKTWNDQGTWLQKALALYVLTATSFNAFILIYIYISINVSFLMDFPVMVPILQYIPLMLLLVQIVIVNWGIYDFTQRYEMQYKLYLPFKVIGTFIPYVGLIYYANFRALFREFKGLTNWEKTEHSNLHRDVENKTSEKIEVYKDLSLDL